MKVRRGDLRDVYTEGGRSVAMVGETVIVLSELATAILGAVPEGGGTELSQITSTVVESFGAPEPPDTAAELTLVNVHELIGHGVLAEDEPRDNPVSTLASVEALRSALRHIRSCNPSPWSLPPPVRGEEFIAAAHQHHVVSFLDLHRDRIALPPGAAASLNATSRQLAAGAGILALELATALDVLDLAGVRALTFKGIALAIQAHGELTARGAGDLDLLVAPEDVDRAHLALTGAAWRHDSSFPHPGPTWAWRHLLRTGHELTLYSGRSTIDLHWHLAPSHDTFPSFDALWERRCLVRMPGRDVPTLSPYDALAHSAGHAAKDGWGWMRSLIDVHLLATDPEVWLGADRRLRDDQLISVGVAARLLGIPDRAPSIVQDAVSLTDEVWDDLLARHFVTESLHRPSPVPGVALMRSLRTLRRTAAGPRDAVRQLAFSLVPPWLSATEPSPHALVAVPRLLIKRVRGVAARIRA